MLISRDFEQTIISRSARDADFARALRAEAASLHASGEVDAAERLIALAKLAQI